MSGFENNIINATNALIRAAMHSPNYVTGISGWTINKDGSAEFNNLNLRGTFTGTNWIMNTDGMFFYNGTPALGNLNLAITNSNASGIDTYGNTYTPGGISIIALAGMANVLTLVDASGNALFGVDASGNVNAQIVNASDVITNGASIVNDIINPMSQGIINRGWTPIGPWPATAIPNVETPLVELDAVIPAGRRYMFAVFPCDFLLSTAPAGATQYIQRIRYTTDGSTPTTSSTEVAGHSPAVMEIPVTSLLNFLSPYMEFIPPTPSVDTLYKMLVCANIQSGSFKYQNSLEARWIDLGADGGQYGNSGTVLGSGTSGGGSKQTYTKTYVGVEFASYYGSTATYGSGANGQRSHNATCYQGCSSGQINGTGDQYSYTRFNYGQIATDLGAGVINWVKLRLTNQHSWYNGGLNAIVGWSSYTGAFGDPLVPGAGTHFAQEVYHMNEGATVTRTMGAWLASAIITGFTSITLGTSAAYTNNTDLNNYGYFAGAGNVNTAAQLTINYTK